MARNLWTVVSVKSKHPRQSTSVVQETEALQVYAIELPPTWFCKLHLEIYTLSLIPAAETETD